MSRVFQDRVSGQRPAFAAGRGRGSHQQLQGHEFGVEGSGPGFLQIPLTQHIKPHTGSLAFPLSLSLSLYLSSSLAL